MEARPTTFAIVRHPDGRALGRLSFVPIGMHVDCAMEFVTLFPDGFWIGTFNGYAHVLWGELPGGLVQDALSPTVAGQWQAHAQAVADAGRVPLQTDLATLAVFVDQRTRGQLDLLVSRGQAEPTGLPGRLRPTRAGVDLMLQKLAQGQRRFAASPLARRVPDYTRIPAEEMARHHEGMVAAEGAARGGGLTVLLVSAAAFVGSMLPFMQWATLLVIVPVLLFHELGHLTAMRLFGHGDARIFFIPFFGAAAASRRPFQKLWQEIVVLLAGPVPGIVLGIALLVFSPVRRSSFGLTAALLLISINVVNLLPLHPLDGGRIVHALVTAGRPRLDLALKIAAQVAFLVLAFFLESVLVALPGILGLLTLRPAYHAALREAAVRRHPAFSRALPARERRVLIHQALADIPSPMPLPTRVGLARQIETRLDHQVPSLTWALPFAAAYVGLFVVGGVGAALVAVWGPEHMAGYGRAMRQDCPAPADATPVACGATFEQLAWESQAAAKEGKATEAGGARVRHGAFVWCAGDQETVQRVFSVLSEARAVSPFCGALPWEDGATSGAAQTRARATLVHLTAPSFERDRQGGLPRLQRSEADAPAIDDAFGTLYFQFLQASADEDEGKEGVGSRQALERQIGERIGLSTTGSCKRLEIHNALVPAPPAQGQHDWTVGVTIEVADGAAFAPLGRALCQAGCRLSVLPRDSRDLRLFTCF